MLDDVIWPANITLWLLRDVISSTDITLWILRRRYVVRKYNTLSARGRYTHIALCLPEDVISPAQLYVSMYSIDVMPVEIRILEVNN